MTVFLPHIAACSAEAVLCKHRLPLGSVVRGGWDVLLTLLTSSYLKWSCQTHWAIHCMVLCIHVLSLKTGNRSCPGVVKAKIPLLKLPCDCVLSALCYTEAWLHSVTYYCKLFPSANNLSLIQLIFLLIN